MSLDSQTNLESSTVHINRWSTDSNSRNQILVALSKGKSENWNLETLSTFDESNISALTNALQNRSLASLSLDFTGSNLINEQTVKNLSHGISSVKNLRSLSLTFRGCTNLSSYGLNSLHSALRQHPTLDAFSIDISRCHEVSDEGLSLLGDSLSLHRSLKKLSLGLGGYSSTADGLKAVGKNLRHMHGLEELTVDLNGVPRVCVGIFDAFAVGFSTLAHLKSLTVCLGYSPCHKVISSLDRALQSLKNIASLKLDLNLDLDESATIDLLKNLSESKSLKRGEFTFSGGLKVEFPKFNGLTDLHLDLTRSSLSAGSFKSLSESIGNNSELECLNVRLNGSYTVGDLAIPILIEGLKNLQKLKCFEFSLEDENETCRDGPLALASWFENHPTLSYISLFFGLSTYKIFKDEPLQKLISSLATVKNLKTLNLNTVGINIEPKASSVETLVEIANRKEIESVSFLINLAHEGLSLLKNVTNHAVFTGIGFSQSRSFNQEETEIIVSFLDKAKNLKNLNIFSTFECDEKTYTDLHAKMGALNLESLNYYARYGSEYNQENWNSVVGPIFNLLSVNNLYVKFSGCPDAIKRGFFNWISTQGRLQRLNISIGSGGNSETYSILSKALSKLSLTNLFIDLNWSSMQEEDSECLFKVLNNMATLKHLKVDSYSNSSLNLSLNSLFDKPQLLHSLHLDCSSCSNLMSSGFLSFAQTIPMNTQLRDFRIKFPYAYAIGDAGIIKIINSLSRNSSLETLMIKNDSNEVDISSMRCLGNALPHFRRLRHLEFNTANSVELNNRLDFSAFIDFIASSKKITKLKLDFQLKTPNKGFLKSFYKTLSSAPCLGNLTHLGFSNSSEVQGDCLYDLIQTLGKCKNLLEFDLNFTQEKYGSTYYFQDFAGFLNDMKYLKVANFYFDKDYENPGTGKYGINILKVLTDKNCDYRINLKGCYLSRNDSRFSEAPENFELYKDIVLASDYHKTLNFSFCFDYCKDLTDSHLMNLAEAMKCCKSLTDINVQLNQIYGPSDEGLNNFADEISKLPGIKFVQLRMNGTTSFSPAGIINAGNKFIQAKIQSFVIYAEKLSYDGKFQGQESTIDKAELRFSNYQPGDDESFLQAYYACIGGVPDYMETRIYAYGIDSKSKLRFYEYNENFKRVQKILLDGYPILENGTFSGKVTDLDPDLSPSLINLFASYTSQFDKFILEVSDVRLEEDETSKLESLLSVIESLSPVKSLNVQLKYTTFSGEAYEKIFATISKFPGLAELGFNYCGNSSGVMAKGLNAITLSSLKRFEYETSVSVSKEEFIGMSKVIANNPSLSTLKVKCEWFESDEIQEECQLAFAKAVSGLSNLISFSMEFRVDYQNSNLWSLIAEGLSKSSQLESITILNAAGKDSMVPVFKSLQKLNKLKNLSLTVRCNQGHVESDFDELALGVKNNQGIEKIRFDFAYLLEFSDETFAKVVQAIQTLPNLKELEWYCENNPKVADKTLEAITPILKAQKLKSYNGGFYESNSLFTEGVARNYLQAALDLKNTGAKVSASISAYYNPDFSQEVKDIEVEVR